MVHRWPFSETNGSPVVHDVIGGDNGTLQGATSLNGAGQMTIPGVGSGFGPAQTNYVQLANNTPLLNNLSNATIEIWIQGLDQQIWARVFDFGEYNTNSNNAAIGQAVGSGLDYFMFTGNANGTGASARYKPLSATYANDQNLVGTVSAASVMATNAQTYYAIVYNAAAGNASLYTNGVLLSRGAIADQLTNYHEVSNYFGRSHYTADNTGNALGAVFDEFRIWNNAKSAAEVAAQAAVGPNAFAGASLLITNSPTTPSKLRLLWPIWASRYGSGSLYSSPALVGASESWTPIGGTVAQVTNKTAVANTAIIYNYEDITPSGTNVFYRLQ
jgi:hypothetical protein